jgi:hypothetical protein
VVTGRTQKGQTKKKQKSRPLCTEAGAITLEEHRQQKKASRRAGNGGSSREYICCESLHKAEGRREFRGDRVGNDAERRAGEVVEACRNCGERADRISGNPNSRFGRKEDEEDDAEEEEEEEEEDEDEDEDEEEEEEEDEEEEEEVTYF